MFKWFNEDSERFMRSKESYLKDNETVQQRARDMANKAGEILKDDQFADKFYEYLAAGYYSISSPIWSNFGRGGLPISCNNVYVDDSMESIIEKVAEVSMQTKHGAGTSAFIGDLRHRGSTISTGGQADGPAHYAALFDCATDIVSQGAVRRGNCAVYLPIDHPDILEFLEIREDDHPIKGLSIGVCISDKWMQDTFFKKKPDNLKVLGRLLRKRFETGYPYIFFTDTANENKPDVYKDLVMMIHSSNLCTEVMLPSSVDESFVCDLSSMNLSNYDEWKNTDAVRILVFFLDAVMSEYIEKTKNIKFMEAANRFAERHRAIGVGVFGWHSFLQKNSIAFDSDKAYELNKEIHSLIEKHAYAASEELARRYGEPPLLKGYGRRNTTLLAIAPTTSSAFIIGQTSQSIEPLRDNYHVKNLAKGKFTYKNPELKKLLQAKGKDTDEVWELILICGGSVQRLDFLSDHEKRVFRTFEEIPQTAVLKQAADRQVFIDQGQSLNLILPHTATNKEASSLILMAWSLGLKSLYYQRSSSPAQALSRSLVDNDCLACEA